jgi:hypothetical protein
MIFLNDNTHIELYDLDDIETITKRIAAQMNTIPKYLYFETDIKLIDDSNVTVINILEEIYKYNDSTFTDLHTNILKYLNPNIRLKEDIIYPWLCSLTKKQVHDDMYMGYLTLNIHTIDDNLNIEEMMEESNNCMELRKNIQNNIKSNNRRIKLFKNFHKIKGINYTEFELENANINLDFNSKNLSLMDIFNNIHLNKEVPFASFNNFFKVAKNFTPFTEWNKSDDDGIILYMQEKKKLKNRKIENYTVAHIKIINNTPVFRFKFSPLQSNNNYAHYIHNIQSVISDQQFSNPSRDAVNGIFYLQDCKFDKYVFSDLVMIDPIFSRFLNINEKEAATKAKSELYIYFKHPKYGSVTANLIEKNDESIINSGKKNIRVHITNSKNIESVHRFQDILSKMFTIYNTEYDTIVNIYKQYIPTFGTLKSKKIEISKSVKRLGDVSPSILKTSKTLTKPVYTRLCSHLPRVISAEEASKLDDSKYMLYPKDDKFTQPNYYVCDEHKDHIYPGLAKNQFESSNNNIPGLPCCYKLNQLKKKSLYSTYINTDVTEEKNTKKGAIQGVIKTKKFVNKRAFGNLPDNISKFFETIDPFNTYMRTGMIISANSFLECVMEAMDILKDVDTSEDYIIDTVQQYRTNLVELAETGICRQEIYNKTADYIANIVKGDDYLNPKMFVKLLETYFSCNIIIFTRENNPEGEMTLPYFSQSYLNNRNTNDNPYIFIYEHTGGESNIIDFPQCELIVKYDKSTTFSFNWDERVSIGCRRMFEELRRSYRLDTYIPETYFPIEKKLIVNQQIDIYGKCRVLKLKFKNNYISLITDPIPPFAVKETTNLTLYKVDKDLAMMFINTYNIQLTKQVVKDGYTTQLVGTLGNTSITIPINNTRPFENLQQSTELVFIEKTESMLDKYNKNKKYARYIVEYALWLLSIFIKNNKYKEIDNDILDIFINENIRVIENFQYERVYNKFSMNGGVMHNNKLILNSKEVLERIKYILKLGLVRQNKKIMNYHTHENIDNYYIEITDFDYYSDQVILYGERSVNKWIKENKVEHKIFNKVQPYTDQPYFFKNKLFNNQIYLAQNTDTIQNAHDIVMRWRDNINNIKSSNTVNTDIYSSVLYSYTSSFEIESYEIKGKDIEYEIEVIGFKMQDDEKTYTKYTALLQINKFYI